MSHRSDSPKRQRTEPEPVDELLPEQSASQLSSSTPFPLHERTTFSPPSRLSSKRSSSPTRETPIILRSAWPPVVVESLNGLKIAPPTHVERLGDLLADGVDSRFIPKGLEQVIKSDPEVGYQVIKPADYDSGDIRSADELTALWETVKNLFLNARDCKDCNRDENAWCHDVLQPLIHLVIRIYGNDRWWFQSVQSQSINPAYLSAIPGPTPNDATRLKLIDRKTDYALSYSHRHPVYSSLYSRLTAANKEEISHSHDTFTKRTALFSGFEVKPAYGVHTEAELQMSIWIAAALRKKQQLAYTAQVLFEPAAMVEPAFTIVGHEHYVYYAYPQNELVAGRNGVHVLGPDSDRFEKLGTDSIRGIFRLVRLYGNLLKYGIDEGEDGYWGGFLGVVLEKLASTSVA
ncbi:hypothetical protein EJ07DRAFT_184824 [Lizonia empirigonia]|nr:hypothetical protein EJ07DRAFT_184824 [Lizonia empirigonia]